MFEKFRRRTSEAKLTSLRHAYARQAMQVASVDHASLEAAIARIPREHFLGPGPWPILSPPKGYRMTRSADPAWLYKNVGVGMMPEKGLNNGAPSFLATLVDMSRLVEGESVIHVGAGLGYFTALIAEVVGPSGRVTAIEYEPDLAARATKNLGAYSNVRVIKGDATVVPLDPADVILANAGVTAPPNTWLDALKPAGRLVVPLTASLIDQAGFTTTRGGLFFIERTSDGFAAQWRREITIYACVGARDPAGEAALASAFKESSTKGGGQDKVTRFYRGEQADALEAGRCWVRGSGWALAYR